MTNKSYNPWGLNYVRWLRRDQRLRYLNYVRRQSSRFYDNALDRWLENWGERA